MKVVFVAACLVLGLSQPSFAESCQEKFVRLLVDGNGDGPVKIHVTQEIKGGATTTNYYYQIKPGHWMTEVIEPANMAWVLTHDNAMYTSADKGKSWKKIRDVDSEKGQVEGRRNRVANAATTRNAVCGEEELDGVVYDTVEADYDTLQNFKAENHHKYWLSRDDGFIVRAFYHLKAQAFETMTTQVVEKAPDLDLPTPN